jgi:protein TonB
MPRDLFGSVTDPPIHVGTRSKYSVPISFLIHLAVLVPLIVIPLLATGALPMPDKIQAFVLPAVTPPDPPVIKRVVAERPQVANRNAAPFNAPERIEPETPYQLEPFETNTQGTGLLDGVASVETLAPVAPPEPPAKQEPVRVGGNVRTPERLGYVAPVYPPVAQAARIQGMVIIQATIDINGRVVDMQVLKSVPLLDPAALDAVRQWRYTPTTLNGQAVPVIMTVTVNFTLK